MFRTAFKGLNTIPFLVELPAPDLIVLNHCFAYVYSPCFFTTIVLVKNHQFEN